MKQHLRKSKVSVSPLWQPEGSEMLNTWALQPIRTSQLILHAKNKTKMKLCCHVFLKAQCCSRRPVASKKTLKTPNGTHSLMMRGISCMQSNEAKYNHLNAQTVLKSSCTPPVQISSASMSADRAQANQGVGKVPKTILTSLWDTPARKLWKALPKMASTQNRVRDEGSHSRKQQTARPHGVQWWLSHKRPVRAGLHCHESCNYHL